MRLLHCTDFHANTHWFRWLAHQAPKFDLVCLSGDLLDMGPAETLPQQIAEITALLKAIPTPLAICSGNHDLEHAEGDGCGRLWVTELRRENVWIDGDRFTRGGHAFYCQAWNEPISASRPHEFWVIHSPPDGCVVAVGESGRDLGDFELGQLCRGGRGPRLALCGHVHTPQAWNAQVGVTRVFNPGFSAAAPWPSHLVFDLEAGTATRRRHGFRDETISIRDRTPDEILRGMPADRLERLLHLTVLNQQIEGYRLTPKEIDECRRRLREMAGGKSGDRISDP